MKGHRLCATLVVFLTASFSIGHSAALKGWYDNYEEALEVARREGKPILADFSATWCPSCRDLEKYTLVHPQVTSRLDGFVKVYVDGDRRKDLISSFKVDGLPTLVAMTSGGKEVDRQVGFVDAGSLANSLDQVVQSVGPAKQSNGQPAGDEVPNDPPRSVADEVENAPDPHMPRQTADAATAAPPREERGRFSLFKFRRSRAPANREVNYYNIAQNDAAESRRSHEEPRYAGEGEHAKPQSAPRTMEISKPVIGEVKENRQVMVGRPDQKPAKDVSLDLVPRELKPQDTTRLVAQAQPGTPDDLPRPMLRPIKNATAPSPEPPPAAPAIQPTKAVPSEQQVSTTKKSALPASIRKLQGLGDSNGTVKAEKPASDSPVKSVEKATAAAEQPQAAEQADSAAPTAETRRVTLQVRTRQDQSASETDNAEGSSAPDPADKTQTAAADSDEKLNEATSHAAEVDDTATAAAPVNEPTDASSEKTATRDDVQRWMRDADEKLIAGRKKEAKAMYDKIVEDDPKNTHGLSDMAYIKAVSLIVDRDDDVLRNKAYQQIRKFEALYPDSSGKDYYTLIRATLAADLGKTNEAHSLLQDFTERFPRSRYAHIAYQTYTELPPVKPEPKGETGNTSKSPAAGKTSAPTGKTETSAGRNSTSTSKTSGGDRKVSQGPSNRTRATE